MTEPASTGGPASARRARGSGRHGDLAAGGPAPGRHVRGPAAGLGVEVVQCRFSATSAGGATLVAPDRRASRARSTDRMSAYGSDTPCPRAPHFRTLGQSVPSGTRRRRMSKRRSLFAVATALLAMLAIALTGTPAQAAGFTPINVWNSSHCLDSDTGNASTLQMWSCTGGSEQRWQ